MKKDYVINLTKLHRFCYVIYIIDAKKLHCFYYVIGKNMMCYHIRFEKEKKVLSCQGYKYIELSIGFLFPCLAWEYTGLIKLMKSLFLIKIRFFRSSIECYLIYVIYVYMWFLCCLCMYFWFGCIFQWRGGEKEDLLSLYNDVYWFWCFDFWRAFLQNERLHFFFTIVLEFWDFCVVLLLVD